MESSGTIITALLAAAGLGALVGLQRQVARGDGDDSYAGVRTFALYGMWGAAAGYFGSEYGPSAFLVATLAFAGLVVASYVVVARQVGDWGTTTEAAAFVTFVVGVLSWQEQFVPAVALSVGTAALLQAKEPLHALSERFSQEDVRSILEFGVISAVVLPLVPNQDMGPFSAINLREIWLMVIFVSAIGVVGYVAFRIMGSRGLGWAGLVGGLVSSTAVTLGYGRMSRSQTRLRTVLAAGILAASGLMYIRVLVEALVVAPEMAGHLLVPMVILFVLVEGAAIWLWRRPVKGGETESGFDFRNPLNLTTALQFGALYGVIAFISQVLIDRVSEASLNVLGAVSGINDVDAITLSTAQLVRDGLDARLAAQVVVAAVTVNTLVKGGLAAAVGSRKLATTVTPVLGVAGALGVVIWLIV